MRQIVLDTETTGLDPAQGHRVIEIGCIELANRRTSGNRLHQYLQPDRDIDAAATEIHGITNEFLADKPRFGDIVDEFLEFIRGAELIIHNAPFDVGFLNHELKLLGQTYGRLDDYSTVLDTLEHARRLHPGQRNSLDALCKRYGIDNSQRELHGALLDAEILADVYLAMTGGQVTLSLDAELERETVSNLTTHMDAHRPRLRVIQADAKEMAEHGRCLEIMTKKNGGNCVWTRMETEGGRGGH